MKKSYFALLRRLVSPAPVVPPRRAEFPTMRIVRIGRVLSEGSGR